MKVWIVQFDGCEVEAITSNRNLAEEFVASKYRIPITTQGQGFSEYDFIDEADHSNNYYIIVFEMQVQRKKELKKIRV